MYKKLIPAALLALAVTPSFAAEVNADVKVDTGAHEHHVHGDAATAEATEGEAGTGLKAAVGAGVDKSKEVGGKIVDGTKEAAGKTKDASIKAYDKTKDASVKAYDKTKDASVKAYDKTKDVSVKAYDKTKDVTVKAAGKTKDAVGGLLGGATATTDAAVSTVPADVSVEASANAKAGKTGATK